MKPAKSYIVFPLDVQNPDEAKALVALLADEVGMFKIGLELFIRSGPDLVRWAAAAGSARIFLDLKLHDIPITVKRAMAQIADLGVFFTTVHCGESRAMLSAAVDAAAGKVHVLGVTVLTSVSPKDIEDAGYKNQYADNIRELVMKKAAMAADAGCSGVVCSGEEVRFVKERFGPLFQAITPGIRPLSQVVKGDDQSRVVTPKMAIERGADYLVIGRPIRDAADPKAAARSIAMEIQDALEGLPHTCISPG
ncbi:orotidine-5'-phosphate decarboxylase [Desulfosarcina sp. OttesenSCG-928-A07]|nr:orotidine-5'-phosphate decarboxylase [Desulfosarcina sp. OttesenSCG-928-G17]MDL2329821.1 orotidine-5'-phosphate decarboxylase [Desulfosarcina sp. OttesenSCG-928-A07]